MNLQFNSLFKRIGAKGDPQETFNLIKDHYSEKHRHYHNLNHIVDCLNEFEKAKHLAQNQDALEMAIWLHDVIYNPQQNNNELLSATFASDLCEDLGLNLKFSRYVADLVLDTEHHATPITFDGKLITDIDLSILGRPSSEFDEYDTNIRKEYIWVSEEQYKEGRIKILETFLHKPQIFSTEFFRNKYETQAKANLERAIRKLSNPNTF